MDFHGIFEKVVVAVIAGIILGAGGLLGTKIYGSYNQVWAEVEWIEVDNPVLTFDTDLVRQIEKALGGSTLPTSLQYGDTVTIAVATIYNESGSKTSPLEFKLSSGLAIPSSNASAIPGTTNSLLISPIDPKGTTRVAFLLLYWPRYINQLTILQDGKLVPISNRTVTSDFPFYKDIVTGSPFIAAMLLFIGGIATVLLIIGASVELLIKDKIGARAKWTSSKDAVTMLAVIERIRRDFPEKLPPSISSPSDVAPTQAQP